MGKGQAQRGAMIVNGSYRIVEKKPNQIKFGVGEGW
jgi:hypothetical protein